MFPELRVFAGGRRFRGSSHPLLHWELLSLLSPALPFRSLSLSLPLFSPSPSFFSLSFFLLFFSLSRPLSLLSCQSSPRITMICRFCLHSCSILSFFSHLSSPLFHSREFLSGLSWGDMSNRDVTTHTPTHTQIPMSLYTRMHTHQAPPPP